MAQINVNIKTGGRRVEKHYLGAHCTEPGGHSRAPALCVDALCQHELPDVVIPVPRLTECSWDAALWHIT